MAYEPQTWKDKDDAYPLAATRMSHIENGIVGEEERAIVAEKTAKEEAESAATAKVKVERERAEVAEVNSSILSGTGIPPTSQGINGQFYIRQNEQGESIAIYGPKRLAVIPNAFPSTAERSIPSGYQAGIALAAGEYAEAEVWGKIASAPALESIDNIAFYIRASVVDNVWSTGYRLKIGQTFCALYKPSGKIGEVPGLIHHATIGDEWGMRAEEHRITVYQKPVSTGVWEVLLEVIDSTYSTGQIGVGTGTVSESINVFGGGAIVAEENPTWGAAIGLGGSVITVPKPTGSAPVDTLNVKTAIEQGATAGSAKLVFSAGKYLINETLIMYSYQQWQGAGQGITVLELAAGTNMDLVQTHEFAEQTGHNKAGGPHHWSIKDMTLNGNGSMQSKTTPSWPLRVYGRFYVLDHIDTQQGAYGGFYSEWGESENGLPEHEAFEECFITNCKFENYYGPAESANTPVYGVYWAGPHDSMWSNNIIMSFYPQHSGEAVYAFGMYVAAKALNIMTSNTHVYGRHSHGLYHENGAKGEHTNFYSEGSKIVNYVISGGTTLMGGFSIGTQGNAAERVRGETKLTEAVAELSTATVLKVENGEVLLATGEIELPGKIRVKYTSRTATEILGCSSSHVGSIANGALVQGIERYYTQGTERGIQLGDAVEAGGYSNVNCSGAQIYGVYLEAFTGSGTLNNGESYEGRAVYFTKEVSGGHGDGGGNTVRIVQSAGNNSTLYGGTYKSSDTLELIPSGAPKTGLYQQQSPAPGASMQVFTNPNVAETWINTPGSTWVLVTAIGAGGGGGSGAVRESGKIAGGGAGAGSGGWSTAQAFTSAISEGGLPVTVGKGGKGGEPVSTNNTEGKKGEAGTASQFLCTANGGGGGEGGKLSEGTTAAAGGFGGAGEGQVGATGGEASKVGQHGEPPTTRNTRTGGGGSGGGITAGNVSEKGGAGGTAGAGSLSGGAAGAVNEAGKKGTEPSGPNKNNGGAGGGGGGAGEGANGGKGGEGGAAGGAGGGGGAARDGFESGAGGPGANGLVIAVTG